MKHFFLVGQGVVGGIWGCFILIVFVLVVSGLAISARSRNCGVGAWFWFLVWGMVFYFCWTFSFARMAIWRVLIWVWLFFSFASEFSVFVFVDKVILFFCVCWNFCLASVFVGLLFLGVGQSWSLVGTPCVLLWNIVVL